MYIVIKIYRYSSSSSNRSERKPVHVYVKRKLTGKHFQAEEENRKVSHLTIHTFPEKQKKNK